MNTRRNSSIRRGGAAALAASALVLAGCSATDASVDEATSDEPVEILFWSWLPNIQTTIDLFEDAHPEITVNLENVGAGEEQYTKMQNAIDAGSGGPDVAQVTYDSVPSFAVTGALADVSQYTDADLDELFLSGVLQNVRVSGATYGVPQDFGPGVMYYREDVFSDAGVEVPETWDEYAAAAETVRSGSDSYMTFFDGGLPDFAYMGLWQNEADPWSVDETTVSIDLGGAESQRWADYWGDLNSRDLLVHSTMGSDEWFRQMGDGQIASWIVGAWGLQALQGNLPDNEGLWRVAPMPSWEAGSPASSQFGGSSTVVLEQSEKKDAATTFALWLNSDPVAVESLKADQGLLPTTNAAWDDPSFLDEEISYLGGQPARQIFAASAESTAPGWEWLPFQVYISSVYQDTVGGAIDSGGDIGAALLDWQDRIVEYAENQGFAVSE
ncbi:sugar ABC transporter substrate-binding protein [Agromyces rhizosphaerae]|uniref:Sugar ABC transporter substrate-binding protein n=1 Tax=Agromyces rhizosphaerae TaxID=88374 RepID=A0A9W6CT55_9MICO|nr:sugar ABC transporter substrate-binding protein [Agromyces rhizosphaerae]GLI26359.1 sugar ABC transporter substrate-binding protein [Agromyces rhizosphaerae]